MRISKKYAILFIMCVSCVFVGCSSKNNQDFISKTVNESKKPSSISFSGEFNKYSGQEMGFEVLTVDDKITITGTPYEGGESIIKELKYQYDVVGIIYESLKDKEGFEFNEKYSDYIIRIKGEEYIENVFEKNGIEQSFLSGEEEYNTENSCWKMVEDVVYYADEGGNYVDGSAFLLFSKNEEFMKGMDECGLGDFFRETDNEVLELLEKDAKYTEIDRLINAYGIRLYYGSNAEISLLKLRTFTGNGTENTLALMDKYAGDCWEMGYCAANSVCDTLIYTMYSIDLENYEYEDEYEYDMLFKCTEENDKCLYIYGKGGEVKEIKFMSKDSKIPETGKDTVINYLVAMGMTESDAKAFVDELPKEDGKHGKLKYYVENNSNYSSAEYILKISK